jgi:hypothetical protein
VALGKEFKKIKIFFAECLTAGHSAKVDDGWPPSRLPPLPTAKFCRVPDTQQRFFYRRPNFAECLALGKEKNLSTAKIYRVPLFAKCPTESTRQISHVQ